MLLLRVLIAILGAFLFFWGFVPIWPGLDGHVPPIVYPLGVLFSAAGAAGVYMAIFGEA